MTEVLVAMVGLLPAVLGFANSRRRQLQVIQQEMETLKALPKGMAGARQAMRKEVAVSVANYTSRRSRRAEYGLTLGYAFGWVLAVIGYNLYKGQVPDDAVDQLRKIGGAVLLTIGVLLLIAAFAYHGTRVFLGLRIAILGVKAGRRKRTIRQKRKQIDDLRQEKAEGRQRTLRLYERTILSKQLAEQAGIPVSDELMEIISELQPFVDDKSVDDLMVSDHADRAKQLLKLMREKRAAFKKQRRVSEPSTQSDPT